MHTEVLEPGTEPVLRALSTLLAETAPAMYLAGGTALALQLGHRISVDLDFFSPDPLPVQLEQQIAPVGETRVVGRESRTLHMLVEGVQVSFFSIPISACGRGGERGVAPYGCTSRHCGYED